MGEVDGKAHVREMETVAQPNQSERNDMVAHQLIEILPRLFQLQDHHNSLLCPKAGLEQIVRFEQALVLSMWKIFEHSRGVEVPDRRSRHNVETVWYEDAQIHGGVHLFHETSHFPAATDAAVQPPRVDETLHEKLTGEGQDDSVESNESEIFPALAVQC